MVSVGDSMRTDFFVLVEGAEEASRTAQELFAALSHSNEPWLEGRIYQHRRRAHSEHLVF